ncbi:TetR/AcrR family transcriptional regulator [Actinokineospora diospyrosa]|uniref:Transcriptional regulator, TetR family n=1 Tax=Actinokineospora diospyrosa TaxID=103728 RepID=A0ABT1ILJ0_9PSEU|nr:TetR/AcrR family transcriptional regulator [Actinokineospora diospyrosa]MCP2273523.1 transcriptional regulator, TetR family [Actinokineospora diospyrosa]
MDVDEAAARLLDTAERLFYERGVHNVGMDDLRSAAGVSLKRVYQCFPSKEDLVVAYLRRRHGWWMGSLRAYVAEHGQDVLAVFDWLDRWFREPGFRGCAFVNSVGELGATCPAVVDVALEHKRALRSYLGELADRAGIAGSHLALLVEGAISMAAVGGEPSAAQHARQAAEELLS